MNLSPAPPIPDTLVEIGNYHENIQQVCDEHTVGLCTSFTKVRVHWNCDAASWAE